MQRFPKRLGRRMEHFSNRRLDRRIPLGVPARIRLEDGSEIEARCLDLSIRGLTLESEFVPAQGEILEVFVDAPGAIDAAPLHVRLEVKRSLDLGDSRYEFGGEIVEVLG